MNTINTYYSDYQNLRMFVADHYNVLFSAENRSVLVQVFCGVNDKDYINALIRQVSELVPHAQIIGTTTSGEIMDGTVSGLKTVLSFSVFQYSTVKIAFAEKGDSDSFELGRSIAAKLCSSEARLSILFSAGQTVDGSRLLKGVQSVNSDLPVAGGISGDNSINRQGFIFCRDGITDRGAVGAVLESDRLSVNQYWHLCWVPIGKEMIITKADGKRVYTIDKMPAYQVYRKYLGVDGRSNMIINSIFPLIASRHGMEIVRMPMFIYEDGSIDFSADMVEGEKVHFSYGHVEMIIKTIDRLIKKIMKQKAESIFVYSCVMRRGFLQNSSEIETLPLQEIAPTAGFFTKGEFFHIDRSNQLLNATMTTLVLSESEQSEEALPQNIEEPSSDGNTESGKPETKYSIESSSIVILKALTNLVNTVTKELNERTLQLEKVNKKTLYASIHDPLTGLYNRGFYEQEMERLNLCKNPLGIMICDIDGLKLINDTLGHSAGDTALKAAAEILDSLFSYDNVVARIGGDEFSVLLQRPSTDFEEKISEAVSKYNSVNPSVPLSLSIGYAGCDSSFHNTDILFKEADNNLYREKLHRKESVRSDLVKTLTKALEVRDIITEEHSNRLQALTADFAEYIGVSQNSISDLRLFARFHDIGKVGISDRILLKPGPLTQAEKIEMQRHSEIGYRIARSSADLFPIADWILKHHEWWNGKGYPFGLKEEEIPFESRILAIVDAYDAMTNDRPYRKALGRKIAIEEIKRCAGTQFDPKLAYQFIECIKSRGL